MCPKLRFELSLACDSYFKNVDCTLAGAIRIQPSAGCWYTGDTVFLTEAHATGSALYLRSAILPDSARTRMAFVKIDNSDAARIAL